MNRILLISESDGLEGQLEGHLTRSHLSATLESVPTIADAVRRMGERRFDAVVVQRPCSNSEIVVLTVAATHAMPGFAVFAVANGKRNNQLDFMLLVRARTGARRTSQGMDPEEIMSTLESFLTPAGKPVTARS